MVIIISITIIALINIYIFYVSFKNYKKSKRLDLNSKVNNIENYIFEDNNKNIETIKIKDKDYREIKNLVPYNHMRTASTTIKTKTFSINIQNINRNCGITWLSNFSKCHSATKININDLKNNLASIVLNTVGHSEQKDLELNRSKLFLCSVQPHNKDMIKLLIENNWKITTTFNNNGGSDNLQIWSKKYNVELI